MPGFYDGQSEDGRGTWRVRFSPDEAGAWRYTVVTRPRDGSIAEAGTFSVTPREGPGFVKATPGEAWGFRNEAGEPVFLMGDTVYNLFGAAHCGMDVGAFLARRAGQGFNVFRARCQVSPFHPPDSYSDWQTRRTWPWGGSEQSPRFDRFNLDYFRTVDEVMQTAADLGVGFEMIMEAWGFEFPFNNRAVFVTEWEQLWLRYLIARYDAFSSVYIWTLMNEYEFYPNGDWSYNPTADRWAMRTARWVKAIGPHGHPIAVHNGPQMPPFAERFAADPEAVDVIMFQTWGTTDEARGWLAAGIEESIERSLAGWPGSAVFAEYGYERNPEIPLSWPGFANTDAEHNRRGAWRGAFSGLGVINGFENTWGPLMDLAQDQEGVRYFEVLRTFLTDVVPFHRLQPVDDVVVGEGSEEGRRPLALASENRDIIAVYFPTGGRTALALPKRAYTAQWYGARSGDVQAGPNPDAGGEIIVEAPEGEDVAGRPLDWVLTLAAVAPVDDRR
jgi:hypothetical protein